MPLTTVTVNQNDINTGIRSDCHDCPVYKAVSRITLPNTVISVHGDTILLTIKKKGTQEITLPDIAVIFIEDFDAHGPTAVKPISFNLDIAQKYLS